MIEKTRLTSIDQLRGIAALSVIFYHLSAHSLINRSDIVQNSWVDITFKNVIAGDYLNFGRFGVILFFIISGYVVPFSFPKQNPIAGFVISRVFRLYPLFWASLTAALFLRFYAGNPLSIYDVLANMTMIPDFLASHRVLDIYWTLAYEVLFYVTVVIIYVCAGPLNLTITRQAAILCACLSIIISIFQIMGQPVAAGDKIILIGFMFLGSTIRKTQIDQGRLVDGWLKLIIVLLMGGIILRGYIHYVLFLYGTDTKFENFNSIIITHAAAIILFLSTLAWFDKLEFPSLTYMGVISYSLYITHPILMEMITVFGLEDALIRSGAYIVSLFVATIILSILTYHFIEQPFIRLGKSVRQTMLNTRT
ncbi:acyltransferase family protein [Agrobacterium sp. NPDC089420]|uniref:acyltransferase family protein n=1 Tax=Agrobacterium sp. NPDC089420 TaxID=3363918 RepID=UPI00384BC780